MTTTVRILANILMALLILFLAHRYLIFWQAWPNVPESFALVFGTPDGGESDDKILAVLDKDSFWGNVEDVSDLPPGLIERVRHYFSTYKLLPGSDYRFLLPGGARL